MPIDETKLVELVASLQYLVRRKLQTPMVHLLQPAWEAEVHPQGLLATQIQSVGLKVLHHDQCVRILAVRKPLEGRQVVVPLLVPLVRAEELQLVVEAEREVHQVHPDPILVQHTFARSPSNLSLPAAQPLKLDEQPLEHTL